MKKKISVSIDEKAIIELEKFVEVAGGSFRNKSHVIEFALIKLMKEKVANQEVGK